MVSGRPNCPSLASSDLLEHPFDLGRPLTDVGEIGDDRLDVAVRLLLGGDRLLGELAIGLFPRDRHARSPGRKALPDEDAQRGREGEHYADDHDRERPVELIVDLSTVYRLGRNPEQFQHHGYSVPPLRCSLLFASSGSETVAAAWAITSGDRCITKGATSKYFIALPSAESSSLPMTSPAASSRCRCM